MRVPKPTWNPTLTRTPTTVFKYAQKWACGESARMVVQHDPAYAVRDDLEVSVFSGVHFFTMGFRISEENLFGLIF